NIFFHPLSKVPGPRAWSASRLPYAHALFRGAMIPDLQKLRRRYGPILRTAPDEVTFAHPKAWADIFQPRPRQQQYLKDSLWWGALRTQEPIVLQYVSLSIERLREPTPADSPEGTVINIFPWLNYTKFDIFGDLAFGESFGCLQDSKYHPWIALIFNSIKAIAFLSAVKFFPLPLIPRVLAHAFSDKALREREQHQGLAVEKVDRRLAVEHDGGKKEMSREENYSNLNLIILAGSETSAAAISGCTYHLAVNADIRRQVEGMIRAEKDITFESTSNMEFLDVVIHESMRKYPSQPIFTPRVAPTGVAADSANGDDGGNIPTGRLQLKAKFSRPDSFDPSRWLGNPGCGNGRRAVFKPFSVGHRNCIGKH
ncbi:cytochrome P450, partial [Mytilinidion resinicola]